MFKAGQIVVIVGTSRIFEVTGPARFSGLIPVEYTVMGVNGRGFQRIAVNLLRVATEAEISEGHRLLALDAQREAAERTTIRIERHRDFLLRRGINPLDTNMEFAAKVLGRELRFAHCYVCYQEIGNSESIECKRCNWIVCDCGACGCGHPDHREKFNNARALIPAVSESLECPDVSPDTVEFTDFTEAVAFIKEIKGYTLSRNGERAWIATKLPPTHAP